MLLLVGNCSYLVYLFPFFSPPRVYLLIWTWQKQEQKKGGGLVSKDCVWFILWFSFGSANDIKDARWRWKQTVISGTFRSTFIAPVCCCCCYLLTVVA